MKHNRLLRRGELAQGTVEFALVVPLFLVLLLGVMEFGWALYTYTTLQHAAQAGVRRGMVLSAVDGKFTLSGNTTGTYPGPITCNQDTIVGTAACNLGRVAPARTTALVVCSSALNCPSGHVTVPAGGQVEVQLRHQYLPLSVGFFPGLNNIVLTGHAEGRTQ